MKSARELMISSQKKKNKKITTHSLSSFSSSHTNWHNYLHSDIDSIRIACGTKVKWLITRISTNDEHQHVKQFGVVASLQILPTFRCTQVVFDIQHFFFLLMFIHFHPQFSERERKLVASLSRAGQTKYTYEACLLNTQTNYFFRSLVFVGKTSVVCSLPF